MKKYTYLISTIYIHQCRKYHAIPIHTTSTTLDINNCFIFEENVLEGNIFHCKEDKMFLKSGLDEVFEYKKFSISWPDTGAVDTLGSV